MSAPERPPPALPAADASDPDEPDLNALYPNAEYDAEMSLAAREEKWGFSLDELRAATKVVRRLFNTPSLFVSDPYLADSRLYTMITRSRQTKRDNREVYKAIQNEEKSRRRRYLRQQDIEAVRKTAMKREREEALNALMLPDAEGAAPPLLLCERRRPEDAAGDVKAPPAGAAAAAGAVAGLSSLSDTEKDLLRLVGAFENVLRLESAFRAPEMDWVAVTQLTAQVYRYVPHGFGSQMPPPICFDVATPTTTAATSNRSSSSSSGSELHDPERMRYHLVGMKVLLARRAVELVLLRPDARRAQGAAPGSLRHRLHSGEGSGEDFVVRGAAAGLAEVGHLRAWAAGESTSSPSSSAVEDVVADMETCNDLLRHVEVFLLEGGADREGFFTPTASAAAAGLTARDVALQSLHLFIARRLYQSATVAAAGPSPVVIEREPPTSDSQEPDTYCVYDDLQCYATPHDPNADLTVSKWIGCHTCKIRYNRLHPYYYSMCHLCGEFNYNKRLMARDLRGKVVLLTGCRIKIGYAMAVSLLRCGATVLGTTRFAHEAVARFQEEPDYHVWSDRLHLFSLDLRDMWVVTQFCAFVRQRFPKLFAIVNNAAQTIARLPSYTEHLRRIETEPPLPLRRVIEANPASSEWHQFFLHHTTVTVGEALSIEHRPVAQPFLPATDAVAEERVEDAAVAERARQRAAEEEEAKRSRIDRLEEDDGNEERGAVTRTVASRTLIFDRYDTQAEESDARQTNSWVMNLAEVQGSEAAEVMSINALSPFILNSKLKQCLTNREGDAVPNEKRFIINVSAMEGQFYRFKQTTHPHTNMAKAALNMMTRTSAADYVRDGIYMNSVDTGWITDESPKLKRDRRAEQYMLCPLDEVDAAARCLDLIYTDSDVHGEFYKDFKKIAW